MSLSKVASGRVLGTVLFASAAVVVVVSGPEGGSDESKRNCVGGAKVRGVRAIRRRELNRNIVGCHSAKPTIETVLNGQSRCSLNGFTPLVCIT